MQMGVRSLITVLALVSMFVGSASAQNGQKSWEVDIYGNDAEVTYVPDGRDDVHVYDHNNHYNDRSYIEIDRPYYRSGHRYDDRRYYRHYPRRDHRYGYRYERPRYRVEYHNRYRYW